MLVLCSNGLSSNEILSYTREKVCFCKTAALVVLQTMNTKNPIIMYPDVFLN